MLRNSFYCSNIIHCWFNTDTFSQFKRFFAALAPIMVGLGGAYRVLDRDNEDDNEENNKCRNCGHEVDEDANSCLLCGTKRI